MKKILYFTASWCGPCRALAPRMEKLASQINYQKIDIDSNQDLSIKYGIRSVPSLVLVDENGNELNRIVGAQPDEIILNFATPGRTRTCDLFDLFAFHDRIYFAPS